MPKLRDLPALRDLEVRRPSKGPNIDALDGVRGLAVLIVIASHDHGLGLRDHGELGVWLFFCLSAFLLTLPLAREPGRLAEPGALVRYARRRIGRIVPLYYATLFFWFGLLRGKWLLLARHVVFERALIHFWTIPQELLFYLALPLLAALHPLLFRRRSAPMIAALALGALAASLLLPVHTWALGIFLSGMTFAYLCAWPPAVAWLRRPGPRRALEIAGFAALALFYGSAPDVLHALGAQRGDEVLSKAYPGSFGVLCGVVILAAVLCEGSALQRLFAWRPLRSIGIVSYGMYLLSPFVTFGLYELGMRNGNAMFLAATALSWAISLVTYSWIERPFIVSRQGGGAP